MGVDALETHQVGQRVPKLGHVKTRKDYPHARASMKLSYSQSELKQGALTDRASGINIADLNSMPAFLLNSQEKKNITAPFYHYNGKL